MKKITHYLKITILLLISTFMIFLSPCQTLAANPSQSMLNFFGINGILYYNPEGNLQQDCITTYDLDLSTVTIIGDSLIGDNTHGVRPYLKDQIQDNNDEISYVAGNYFTGEGIDKIKELQASGQLRKNIIYALGTDDVDTATHTSTITQAAIDEVLNAIGPDHTIYFVTNYTIDAEGMPGTATDFSASNALLKQVAQNNSNIYIIDYANLVSRNLGYFQNNEYRDTLGFDDGIHLNVDGYSAYAKLIAESIRTYSGTSNTNCGCVSGSNSNYSGAQVLDQAIISAIQANQVFYKNAADKYGFDWRIIAAIHVMEHSASRSNPTNGQGAYQLYSYTNGGTNSNAFLPAGAISDEEFQRQTDIAANLIANQYGAGLNLNTAAGIKTLFFRYNGTAQKYIDKAIALGFDEAAAKTGEGSPYVMNKYDIMRDPSNPNMSPKWPGMYVGDGKWSDTATTSRPGAYTIYVALGGTDGGSAMECYILGAGGGRLVAGANGMNLSQARDLMQIYKDNVRGRSTEELMSLYGMTDNNCAGGIAYNCVSFSRYFINMYTDYTTNHITIPLGNGADFVNNLLSRGYNFTDGGHTPRPYAIFSTTDGSTMCGNTKCGHTGVVLGVNTNTDTIIIGQAACGSGEAGVVAKEESLSKYMSTAYHYAYPNKLLLDTETPPNNTPDNTVANYNAASETTTITIPGLTRDYKIAWVSDMHIIADGPTYVGQERYDSFVNNNGVHSANYWETIINYLNQSNFDAVVFGGDIADYYSSANYQTIRDGLSKLTMPWFYIAGGDDHDLYSGRTNDTPSNSLTSDSSAGSGDVIDLGEIMLVGLNNSANANISSSELNAVTNKIKNAGKPVILVTHVPFESQVNSLMSTIKSAHNGQAYYWTDGSYHWDYGNNSAMREFANTNLYNDGTNVVAVLAGHVHELSDDRQLSAKVKQHIFKASYKGPIGIINVRGN